MEQYFRKSYTIDEKKKYNYTEVGRSKKSTFDSIL